MERHDPELFRKRLALAIEHNEMKPRDLAEDQGLSEATVQSWLSGRYEPKVSVAARVADRLNVSLEWLAGGLSKEGDVLTPGDTQRLAVGYRQIFAGGNIIKDVIERK